MASSILLAAIGAAFWREDLRYSLPTPRPPALVQPAIGSHLAVASWLREAGLDGGGKPVLVHFFNPDCPCTRFNVAHLRELVARFGSEVFFVGAAEAEGDGSGALEVQLAELGLGIPHFVDGAARRAREAGVYSTPEAVLVDVQGRLIYRGNYNTSRYCTDPRTEFVRIALEGLHEMNDRRARAPEAPVFGCELPGFVKRDARAGGWGVRTTGDEREPGRAEERGGSR